MWFRSALAKSSSRTADFICGACDSGFQLEPLLDRSYSRYVSKVVEIEMAIERLPVPERKAIAAWLQEQLEDQQDLAAACEAKSDSSPRVPLGEIKQEFGLT